MHRNENYNESSSYSTNFIHIFRASAKLSILIISNYSLKPFTCLSNTLRNGLSTGVLLRWRNSTTPLQSMIKFPPSWWGSSSSSRLNNSLSLQMNSAYLISELMPQTSFIVHGKLNSLYKLRFSSKNIGREHPLVCSHLFAPSLLPKLIMTTEEHAASNSESLLWTSATWSRQGNHAKWRKRIKTRCFALKSSIMLPIVLIFWVLASISW